MADETQFRFYSFYGWTKTMSNEELVKWVDTCLTSFGDRKQPPGDLCADLRLMFPPEVHCVSVDEEWDGRMTGRKVFYFYLEPTPITDAVSSPGMEVCQVAPGFGTLTLPKGCYGKGRLKHVRFRSTEWFVERYDDTDFGGHHTSDFGHHLVKCRTLTKYM